MRRPVSAPEVRDCDFEVLLVASVQEGVVVDAVSPAAPEHSEPGAAEGADRAWWSCPRVRAAAYLSWAQGWWCRVASASVEVAGRRRWSQPWRARDSLAAGLDRDWDHAGVGCEVLCGRVSGSVIADLSQERGGADHRFGYVNLANQPSE
jgi:hypothetical protein